MLGPTVVRRAGSIRRMDRIRVVALALVVGMAATTPAVAVPGGGGPPAAEAPARLVRLPVEGEARVHRLFDPPAERWSRGHRGVDLEASVGAAVLAPADGTVAFVGRVVDRGVVTIEHPGGLRTSLEPVTGTVGVGDVVRAGAVVGVLEEGAGHCVSVSCLHWGVRDRGAYVDPLALLGRRGTVRLLPVP